MPAAIILAAGSSARLGRPKQTLRIDGQTLLERAVQTAHGAGLAPIYVELSPEMALHFERNGLSIPAYFLVNREAGEGMASSIRLGIQAAIDAEVLGAIILACDQVALTSAHLRRLAEGGSEVRASAYAGRTGVPAYFPATSFASLLRLRGDTGARDLLRDAHAVPLVDGELDIDTPADLERLRLRSPE